jgi:protoheme IX farnesyltransferase
MKPEAVPYEKSGERAPVHSKLGDVLILAKVRLNALVVATTAGGFYMAAETVDAGAIAAACAGTALVASGASAANQITERHVDRLMVRTRQRPLADGRMSVPEGWAVAAVLAGAGSLLLAIAANMTAALIALATLAVYVMVYTPLKRRTSLATVVGAVPGALPPLVGWAAAGGSFAGPAPWSLFIIMFLWQLPHFLAIAWIYRDDYARAGLVMLPVIDRHGAFTGRQATLWAATLVPFSLVPFLVGLTGAAYALGAIVAGFAQLAVALQFARHRSEINARRLFYASILYLPLLWMLMVVAKP